ncbi:hypothetical protein [Viscerimonas tarda]
MKVIILILLALFIFAIFLKKSRKNTNVVQKTLPDNEIENDKLIVVKEADESVLKKVISDFCETYNENGYVVLPRLTKMRDREYAITFPYDVDFSTLCFFVNYLVYPIDIDWFYPNVLAWATLKQKEDQDIPQQCMGKKVMLYVAGDDTDSDNVFLTNEDNISFEISFTFRAKNYKPLNSLKRPFSLPTTDKDSLSGKLSEDFK